jgi:hypothetical protein
MTSISLMASAPSALITLSTTTRTFSTAHSRVFLFNLLHILSFTASWAISLLRTQLEDLTEMYSTRSLVLPRTLVDLSPKFPAARQVKHLQHLLNIRLTFHQRTPENWYKRDIGDEYSIPYLQADTLLAAARFPKFLNIGGNMGQPTPLQASTSRISLVAPITFKS